MRFSGTLYSEQTIETSAKPAGMRPSVQQAAIWPCALRVMPVPRSADNFHDGTPS